MMSTEQVALDWVTWRGTVGSGGILKTKTTAPLMPTGKDLQDIQSETNKVPEVTQCL